MGSQLADLDGDGRLDLVTATFDGSPHWARGTAEGFAEPTHVLDRWGRRIHLGMYWDFDAERWMGQGPASSFHVIGAVVHDLDHDGDLDLLLADKKQGGLFVRWNEAPAGQASPAFSAESERVRAGGEELALSGGIASVYPVDWDGDGRDDLVCSGLGSRAGARVVLLLDTADQGPARFAAPVDLLVGDPENGVEGGPLRGLYADPVDVDGDGDLDLLVGGYAPLDSKPPVLTPEQEVRLDELQERQAELSREMRSYRDELQALVDELPEAEREQAQKAGLASQEYLDLLAEYSDVRRELKPLLPGPDEGPGVWVFLRDDPR